MTRPEMLEKLQNVRTFILELQESGVLDDSDSLVIRGDAEIRTLAEVIRSIREEGIR